jgi:Excreted virulence factor EspC, type VII ESX diderm
VTVPDGFQVLVGELRAHASQVDGLADRLEVAGRGRPGGDGHRGVRELCAFLVPVVRSVSTPGQEALGQAARPMADIAGRIRWTATSYDDTDGAGARGLSGGGA